MVTHAIDDPVDRTGPAEDGSVGSGCGGDGPELVHGVGGGHLVGLGQGEVVEDGPHQIVHRAARRHEGLADVHDLGRPGAEQMDSEQLAVDRGDQELEDAVGVAQDLSPSEVAVAGEPDLVGDGGSPSASAARLPGAASACSVEATASETKGSTSSGEHRWSRVIETKGMGHSRTQALVLNPEGWR